MPYRKVNVKFEKYQLNLSFLVEKTPQGLETEFTVKLVIITKETILILLKTRGPMYRPYKSSR